MTDIRYEWNPRSGSDNYYDADAPEPEPVRGEGEIVGSYNDEHRGPCFILLEDGDFRIMAISACKPIP